MIELNVRFQEEYKKLDVLCKDIFSSKDGVSVYISEMEKTSFQYHKFAYDWDEVYKNLKHLRWMRNQLAHEVGAFNSDLCSELDLKWLKYFYNSILNRTDPLAQVGQAMRQQNEHKSTSNTYRQNTVTNVNTCKTVTKKNTRPSLWSRIKTKFKKWFS